MPSLAPLPRRHHGVATVTGLALLAAVSLAPGATAQDIPAPTGRIAYLEDRARIRVVDADGSDDRAIFGLTPDATAGIESVSWRPDGRRLAFASGHEELCSIWLADLYLVDDTGANLSRLTNGPACQELASLPQGSVRVTLENRLTDAQEFLVHVQGVPTAVGAVVEPGFRTTFEVTGVHDLGPDVPQFVAVSSGTSTWFDGTVFADVQPDMSVDAGVLALTSDAFESWGALSASWSHDGTRVAYQLGLGALWQIDAAAGILDIGRPLFEADPDPGFSATTPAWSPVDDRVLYQRFDDLGATIDLGRADASRVGDTLLAANVVQGLDWLPDGSGFVYSDSSPDLSVANLFLADLRTGSVDQIASVDVGLALWPTVSPDGRFVAYSYTPVALADATTIELRVRHLATGTERLLVANGSNADWGP